MTSYRLIYWKFAHRFLPFFADPCWPNFQHPDAGLDALPRARDRGRDTAGRGHLVAPGALRGPGPSLEGVPSGLVR